ncbi:curli-like amyloid fiber formation chaperone CsgH [Pseudomonas petrae]|uniref:Curli assembly protein CsgC n=1 Tax=Pseudomonas petrae TaxID=2912190 RepID=A0ABS9IBE0_9PSED|nr:curli-like amyloid fiber formation chaperone CsgH [Pseudomonas petrae]MCF7535316.1 hypothetical protein [Pseudomonas petrae]MCF7539027.1 hypothetical protein [Pseudomonas petrae]MCF7544576.1 hypothetical protein [Pseudomonas petrae]MCF7556929.1 hypothetical protein [Pseudomonas petrae]
MMKLSSRLQVSDRTIKLVVTVDAQRSGSTAVIRPHLENPAPLTLQYRMTVRQISAQGTSTINQQGDLQNGVPANSVSLNLRAEATCQVHLDVFDQSTLIKALDSDCGETTAR